MRVTQNTTANLVLQNLQIIEQRQEVLQQEASTGMKISSPSDDPTTAQQIVRLQSQTAATNQYARNITNGTALLTMANSAMSSMSNTLTSVKQLALQMSNGTNSDPTAMSAAVQQLQQLKSQFISLGNTQLNGTYLFGGFKNDTPPFDSATGTYTGTTDTTNYEIAPGSSVPVAISGSQVVTGGTPPGSSGTDIMGMFDNLISALNSGNSAGVQAQLGTIDKAATQITSAEATVGSSMNRLTTATTTGQDNNLATTQVISSLQDADYTQVVSDLSKQQTAYQAAIASSAKISQISLLDYLQ